MGCEQRDTSLVLVQSYEAIKSDYLKNPGNFVFQVVHDAVAIKETRRGNDIEGFWIKVFTGAEVVMMSETELRILINGVQNFLETDRGKTYHPEECQELLSHLETIAEVRKASCTRMVPDL